MLGLAELLAVPRAHDDRAARQRPEVDADEAGIRTVSANSPTVVHVCLPYVAGGAGTGQRPGGRVALARTMSSGATGIQAPGAGRPQIRSTSSQQYVIGLLHLLDSSYCWLLVDRICGRPAPGAWMPVAPELIVRASATRPPGR